MRRWDETLAKHCPQTVSKARMSTPLSTFRHEINKKTMKQNTFYTPMRGILKTMKYNISSKIIGLTVHLISKKHNHFTCYNRNKILYYSILKCSNIIFHVFLFLFLLSFRFSCSGTSRLFNEGCLDYTTVTYVYLPSGKSWRARLNMKSESTPFKNIVRTTTALITNLQLSFQRMVRKCNKYQQTEAGSRGKKNLMWHWNTCIIKWLCFPQPQSFFPGPITAGLQPSAINVVLNPLNPGVAKLTPDAHETFPNLFKMSGCQTAWQNQQEAILLKWLLSIFNWHYKVFAKRCHEKTKNINVKYFPAISVSKSLKKIVTDI